MEPRTRAKTVFVCDNDNDTLDCLYQLLRGEGYNVSTAHDHNEFAAKFPLAKPDLVILEIRLPEHDGFWIAGRLEAMGCKAPIIFLTAYDRSLYRLYAPIAGAIDYLTKPIDLDFLLERIERALVVDARVEGG